MVRSLWAGALAGVLACAAPGWAQPPANAGSERVITVKEPGQPEAKCRLLRCWTQKDGSRVCEVQDVATGEKLTILEEIAGTNKKSLAQIFRWGKSAAAPEGAPAAPADAVTVGTEAAMKSSRFGRTTAAKKPALSPVTKSNPRESWGKVEKWTADDSEKAVQTASARAEAASPRRPVAAKEAHDPLLHPETFAPTPAVKTEVVTPQAAPVGTTTLPAPNIAEAPPVATRPNLMSRLRGARMPAAATAPATTAPGMGSVMAANSPQMAREMDTVVTRDKDGAPVVMPRSEVPPNMVAVDVTAPNAFSAPMPTRLPTPAPAHIPMPPMAMPGGGTMMAGMSMAPAYPPGMMPGQPTMQAMPHPGMMAAAPMPAEAMPEAASQTAQLLHQLHQAALPSEREMAADQLSRVNWRAEPAVVQGLLDGAKSDPAPMVRACCVQALAKMKANTVPVVQAVNACKQDGDSRVRQAAEQALAELTAP